MYISAKLFISATLAPACTMLVMFCATVLTCVAIGTNLWKVYVCVGAVDSTKNPKFCGIVVGTPVIVTVFPDPAPFAIVTVVPLGVNVVLVAAILNIAD